MTGRWRIQILAVSVFISIWTWPVTVSALRRHYARSSKDLRELAEQDFKTMLELRSWKDSMKQESALVQIVEGYLEDFRNSTTTINETDSDRYVDETVKNPLSMFKLIQRVAYFMELTKQYATIEDLPLSQLDKQFGDGFPLEEDLIEAVDALLRVHFIYNLNVTDLAAGKVNGIQTGTKLVAANCLYIGFVAKSAKKYALAIDWMKEAERLAETDGTVDNSIIQGELRDTIKLHDEELSPGSSNNRYFFTRPLHSLDEVKRQTHSSVRSVLFDKYGGKGRNCSYWPVNYWGLCAGAKFQSPKAQAHLFCWLEFQIRETFRMGPLKMEFLTRNPDVVQIYDAFSESEIEEIIVDAGGLRPSTVVDLKNKSGDGTKPDSSRSSSNTFLKPWDLSEKRLNRKVQAMTGLHSIKMSAKEEAQVANYVPGGHYEFHVDSLQQKRVYGNRGDRIATFMIYLNNVESGGYTVFPTAFAAAVPTRGSAIFWFNSLSDGSPDFSSIHAACPVTIGEKWVSNKWIRYYDQFSVRQCSLNPKERFQFPVNGKFFPVPQAFHHPMIDEHEYNHCKPLTAVEQPPATEYQEEVPVAKYTYSLIPNLKALIRLDWEIYQNVSSMLTTGMETMDVNKDGAVQELESIQRYMQDFNESLYKKVLDLDATEVVEMVAVNPLAIYRTFWRFENYVKKWRLREIQESKGIFLQIQDYIKTVYDVSEGPTATDLADSMTGILRIQNVYKLKSNDIAKGIVARKDASIYLSAIQCLEIGYQALRSDQYYQAVEWMKTAVQKIKYEGDTTATLEKAETGLEAAKKTHDVRLKKSEGWEPNFYVSPTTDMSDSALRQPRIENQYEYFKMRNETNFVYINYCGLCQGRSHQTPDEKNKLFCWHETESHPYWKIGPLKAEILSVHPKPEVVQYHDLLTEKQMVFLKSDENRQYSVSGVYFGKSSANNIVDKWKNRVSTNAWLDLTSSQETAAIAKLMNRVTRLNLSVTPYPVLQIAAYSPGGHYTVHTDSDGYDDDGEGARIATLMFYLSDVDDGGGTAFSQAGVHVTPKKGSAIFWYNLQSSGHEDKFAWHGACPVIFGEKIVATQWMHYTAQTHLQCHTEPTKKLEVLVNGKSKYGKESF